MVKLVDRVAWRVVSLVIVGLGLVSLVPSIVPAQANASADPDIAAPVVSGSPPRAGPALRAGWQRDFARPEAAVAQPVDEALGRLGMLLFFDPVLSGARTLACATCHQPANGWADTKGDAVGERGISMHARSPTLENVAYGSRFGWDGKFPTLESVTFRAITGESNMNLPEDEALGRLRGSPAYRRLFQTAFGNMAVTRPQVEEALAVFERSLVSGVAPFDRWLAGDETAMSAAAKRGFSVFDGKGECSACHSGWAFTDHSFQDIGSAVGDDLGRGARFPSSVALQYAFKVPTLRDVLIRSPYMHNGSKRDLMAVINNYDAGGIDRPSRSSHVHPLHLTAQDKSDLISFLASLTGVQQKFTAPLLPR